MSDSTPRVAPIIGQLPDRTWAVFNMQGTPLWDRTFPGPRGMYDAFHALVRYYQTQGMTRWEAYCEAGKAERQSTRSSNDDAH